MISSSLLQEFIDWVEDGCFLSLSENFVVARKRSTASEIPIKTIIEHAKPEPRARTNSDVDEIRLPPSTSAPSSPPRLNDHGFFQRLLAEEVVPALDFADHAICRALWMSLGHLGVEMEPLSPAEASAEQSCPLVPRQKVAYSLKLEVSAC